MTRIHATAIVDATAQLGAGTEIGPYCVVGPGVILGDDCWLQHHASVSGPAKVGGGNRFYAFCSIGERSQDLKYAGEPTHLEIGDGNVFREFVTVNRATAAGAATTIGSRGNFLAYSHIAHDCRVGDAVIFSNNGTLAGHVEVGDHAIIGGLTAIHQFCRIGRHAITGGCSKIVQDVPPFMMADGNPAAVRGVNNEGMKRHGFSDETMRQLKEAFRILYRSKLNVKQAIERMRESLSASPEIDELLEFLASTQRGIIR